MLDPRKVLKVILYWMLFCLAANITLWVVLLVGAHNHVSNTARMLAYPVAEEGCLPQGETINFTVYEGGTWTEVKRELNLKTQYTKTFKDMLVSKDNFLGLFLSYDDTSIHVVNVAKGSLAYSYLERQENGVISQGAQRGEAIKIKVTGRLKLPMMFYVGWERTDISPSITVPISKEITLYTYKYKKEG